MEPLTRTNLNVLVERVVRRLSESPPQPATAKTGNFRYNVAGEAIPDDSSTVATSGTTQTQMPPTQHPPTMPATKSTTQRQADAELQGSNISRNPAAMRNIPSQKSMKVNAIKKALDTKGYTATPDKAKHVAQGLNAWYSQLDPSDALVATADELAARFANEG